MSESSTSASVPAPIHKATIWASRVLGRPLLDADGTAVGTIADLVLVPGEAERPPVVNGFVAAVDRRKIFVHRQRVAAVDGDGVHLVGGTIDLRRFRKRSGEVLASGELFGTKVQGRQLQDLGFDRRDADGLLEIDKAALASASRFRLRANLDIVEWHTVADVFVVDANAGEVARLRSLHKADAARRLGALPEARRNELAAELDAGQLADVLEELPEAEQVEILARLDHQAAFDVLEAMEADDAIDLLKELPVASRESFLADMEEPEAARIRILLAYGEDTAGGLMTPEPVIVDPGAPVAEVVARLRDSDLPPALAARAFVAEPPLATPTGPYRGTVTLQRLLQEPPSRTVEDCLADHVPTVFPNTPEREVAEILARYDLLSVAVLDGTGRLLGAVTVDDVILRLVERTWGLSR